MQGGCSAHQITMSGGISVVSQAPDGKEAGASGVGKGGKGKDEPE